MNGVHYRDAEVSDAAALADFQRETFLATFGHLYSEADKAAYLAATYGARLQAAEIMDAATWHRLAFVGARMIGFAKAGAFKLPMEPEGSSVRELHRLYVTEDAKGAGVAAALMDWAMARARAEGADAMYLGVYQHNIRAQRFYRRHGFEIVGEYFFNVGQARDPEFIMRAAL